MCQILTKMVKGGLLYFFAVKLKRKYRNEPHPQISDPFPTFTDMINNFQGKGLGQVMELLEVH